MAAGAVILN